MTKRACRVTEAEDALVVTLDVVVCDSLLTCVNVEDERSSTAASGRLPSAGGGARLQHHSPLSGCWAGRDDRPMQGVAGRDRGARPGPGAARSGCRRAAPGRCGSGASPGLARCACPVPGVPHCGHAASGAGRARSRTSCCQPRPRRATRTRSTWWDRRCWPAPAARVTGRSAPSWPCRPTRCAAGSAGRTAAPSGCACPAAGPLWVTPPTESSSDEAHRPMISQGARATSASGALTGASAARPAKAICSSR
jgi:hypothetical protein